jgi:hypothetical protein
VVAFLRSQNINTNLFHLLELPFEQVHNESVRRLGEPSSPSTSQEASSEPSIISTPETIAVEHSTSSKQPERPSSKSYFEKVAINSKEMPRPATPSTVEPPTVLSLGQSHLPSLLFRKVLMSLM